MKNCASEIYVDWNPLKISKMNEESGLFIRFYAEGLPYVYVRDTSGIAWSLTLVQVKGMASNAGWVSDDALATDS